MHTSLPVCCLVTLLCLLTVFFFPAFMGSAVVMEALREHLGGTFYGLDYKWFNVTVVNLNKP